MLRHAALTTLLLTSTLGCSGLDRLRTDDGLKRTYRLHLPEGRDGGEGLPLVIDLHGGGGDADGAAETTQLDALADREGFAVVHPNGTGKKLLGKGLYTWNGDYCCGESSDAYGDAPVDDVAFIDQLIDHLHDEVGIDTDRVYVTGISNGGILAHRLACELPHRIAAIAPVGAPGPRDAWCDDASVPTLIIHGTDDPCALWDGGEECGGCFAEVLNDLYGLPIDDDAYFECMAVPDQVDFWRGQNGCTAEVIETTFAQGDTVCEAWTDCVSGAPVELCTIEGGGHTWPGSDLGCTEGRKTCDLYAETVGPISTDLDASAHMWDFFRQH